MDFPVESIVDQAVKNQTNALVGTKDINLNTIIKMSIMSEMAHLEEDNIKEVLVKIYDANKAESYWIHKEYELTLDVAGNIVSLPNTNGETQKNTIRVDDESEGSKAKLE